MEAVAAEAKSPPTRIKEGAKALSLLVADSAGQILDLPGFPAFAQNGATVREPESQELMPMPKGAHLYFLPDRYPMADNPITGKGLPVAAILPQGYLRTLSPAYGPSHGIPWLPYFGYTACFLKNEKMVVAAVATNADKKWDPKSFPQKSLQAKITKRLAMEPDNRLLHQLAKCAAEYHCYTAANIFFERWEGALPLSPSCNATCRGCISKADDPGPPSPQERLNFIPTLEESIALVKHHFVQAKEEPILSFGQGCEGEPLLQAPLIEKIIGALRDEFPKAQWNLNTNGSKPHAFEKLCKAGLNSVRVSLNSAQETWYSAYYRPKNYSFDDVKKTIQIAKHYGVFVSLNLLCFPGVTDNSKEIDAFVQFLNILQPNLIQLRNLNIDPWRYLTESIGENVSGIGIGMVQWLELIRREFPQIQIGNFTPYVKAG